MNCNFQQRDEKYAVCTACGRKIRAHLVGHVAVKCRGTSKPSLLNQAANYAKAVTQHVLTGSQTRTDEEVSELMQLCESCEHYDQQIGRCGVCGCRCNKSKSAWLNKLRMASQHCPKGKW